MPNMHPHTTTSAREKIQGCQLRSYTGRQRRHIQIGATFRSIEEHGLGSLDCVADKATYSNQTLHALAISQVAAFEIADYRRTPLGMDRRVKNVRTTRHP